MSNAFLREFDDLAHAAFAQAGLADFAQYTPPGGSAEPPRRVYVNNARQMFAQDGFATAPRTVIGVLLADGAVAAGGTLALGEVDASGAFIDSGESLRLQRLDETDADDGSVQWWVVTHG